MDRIFNNWNYQILPVVGETNEIKEDDKKKALQNNRIKKNKEKNLQKNMRQIIEMV